MKFRQTDRITAQERGFVDQQLSEYNRARGQVWEPRELGVFVEDEDGAVQGALTGETNGLWLKVEYLWVRQALRGQKLGGTLLELAEAEARRRGCRYSFLSTFQFQAPQFYEKMGYRLVLELVNYPCEGKRLFYTKILVPCEGSGEETREM